ncbi:MAG: mechanosensitive ion channel family protein [Candidatus Omnitrophica bacterium]|nr:mechanosensitive ion channel family protein [Candidatus Omnitrophota bacterium]
MNQILQASFLNNTVSEYVIAVFLFLVGCLVIKVVQHIILNRLTKWAEKTKTSIDDFVVNLVQRIALPLLYIGLLYVCLNTLNLHDQIRKILDVSGTAVLTLFVARFITILIDYSFSVYCRRRKDGEAVRQSLQGILRTVKFVVWGGAAVFFLDNSGFKISAVIAGLGIGGVAVALAAQAVLGDLFSYFAILFDRPFEIGDFIIIGDYMGVVEHIGIKTTRISSLGGEQLIFSNSDLTGSRVRNYKRMKHRRVVFKLGVTYDTPLERMKAIPEILKDTINGIEKTRFDRAHFFSYGDFSLIYEIVYYVLGADYNLYMDIQQDINFQIREVFQKKGIEFAFPTQTLHLEGQLQRTAVKKSQS